MSRESYTMLERAIILACELHASQKDKAGKEYILHPLAVMLSVKGEDAQVVAVLHDVIEDCRIAAANLRCRYPENIVSALEAVSRQPREKYMDYIRRCAQNPLAREVKIADLHHNISRLSSLDPKQGKRLAKRYAEALKYLMGVE